MADSIEHFYHYYSRHGIFTAPKYFGSLLDDLPKDIDSLSKVVQGLFLQSGWELIYGLEPDENRSKESDIRYILDILDAIGWKDERPLQEPRTPEKRIIGSSRHFALFLTTLLRQQKIPARVRVGYANYLKSGNYSENWVCEYWLHTERRWVTVDPTLDHMHLDKLEIIFDPLDIPDENFLNAGKAWMLMRSGQVPEDMFSGFSTQGTDNVKGALLRDFLAFNKIEILPWDGWGMISKDSQYLKSKDIDELSMIATLTNSGEDGYRKLRLMYDTTPRLQVPSRWQGLKKEDW